MEVIDAIRDRRSYRTFKPDRVPREILEKVIEDALHSPSSSNTQPWSLVIIGGKPMEELRQALVETVAAGTPETPDVFLPEPSGEIRERRRALMKQIYGSLGISREDEEKRALWWRHMDRFFEAPNGIIVCVEKSLLPRALVDVGMLMQTIMLAAHGHGLGTCAASRMVHFPAVLRRLFDIPESKAIVCSIVIGYPDPEAPVNQFRSAREPVHNMAAWYGVD